MLEKIKLAFKNTFSIENLQNGIRNAFSKKNLIRHFIDAVIAVLILFTFFGEYFIGKNIPIIYLILVMTAYLTYALYKWICHLQDRYEEEKEKIETSLKEKGKR